MRHEDSTIPAAVGLFLALSLATGIEAETLLTVRQLQEMRSDGKPAEVEESSGFVWISNSSVRIDEHGMTFVMSEPGDVLFLVDHDRRTKEILRLPASIESLLSEWEQSKLLASSLLSSETTLERIESREVWKGKTVTVYRAASRAFFLKSDAEIWVVESLDIHDLAYRRALRGIFSIDLRRRWMIPVLDLEGFIVRMETRQVFAPNVVFTETTEIVSVEDVASAEGRYSPPMDYLEVPVDTSRWYMISRGKPLP